MTTSATPSAKHPLRRLTATLLAVVYLSISLAPLFAGALHSETVLQVLTNQCSGDCDICGCAPESRAAGTCCCARKQHLESRLHEERNLPECCRNAPPEKGVSVLSCGCPCGGSKSILVAGAKTGEVIPYYFTSSAPVPHCVNRETIQPPPLISRHSEPPDPPPRLV